MNPCGHPTFLAYSKTRAPTRLDPYPFILFLLQTLQENDRKWKKEAAKAVSRRGGDEGTPGDPSSPSSPVGNLRREVAQLKDKVS